MLSDQYESEKARKINLENVDQLLAEIEGIEALSDGKGYMGAAENDELDDYISSKKAVDRYAEQHFDMNDQVNLLKSVNIGDFEQAKDILSGQKSNSITDVKAEKDQVPGYSD